MSRLKQLRTEIPQTSNLESKVFLHLACQSFPVLRNLSIDADQAKVIMSGTVGCFHERQNAINSVRPVAGVIKFTGEIAVASR